MIIGLMGSKGSGKSTIAGLLAKELNGKRLAFADPMKRFCMKALGLTERQLWGDQKEKPISKKQLKALRGVPEGRGEFTRRLYFPDPLWRLRWSMLLAQACGVEKPRAIPGHPTWHQPWYVNQDVENALLHWWSGIKERKGLTPRTIMQTFGTEFGRKVLRENFWIDEARSAAYRVLDGYDYHPVEGFAKRHGGSDAVVIEDVRFRNEVLALKRIGAKIYRVTRGEHDAESKDKHSSEWEQLSIPNFWCDGIIENSGTKESLASMIGDLAENLRHGYTLWA